MAITPVSASDPVAPLENLFNTGYSQIDTVIGNRAIQTYKWPNAAARTVQTGMSEGDQGYQSDTDTSYFYTGSTWRTVTAGLNLMMPTTATNGTIVGGGRVTFSAATTVSINGVFNSTFVDYYLVVDITARSTASNATIRMRSGVTDATGNDYTTQRVYGTGATTTSNTATATMAEIEAGVPTGASAVHLNLHRPQLAVPTIMVLDYTNHSGTALYRGTAGVLHNVGVSYDGITFSATSGTITGTAYVYGVNPG